MIGVPWDSTSPSIVRLAIRWSMSIDNSIGAYKVSSTVDIVLL
jgi:hypothetical protein